MLDKTYSPAEIEARVAQAWEKADAFAAGRRERRDAPPFSIAIPPPNVTGSLHMGHALNNTLQDILCRYWRMKGRDVLWQPGTDHAGIATQMVVERQLLERQQPSRRAMGRDAFLERVWAWKAESGGTIVSQLKRLGASCDWSRERFTMGSREEGERGQMQRAVVSFFNTLSKTLDDNSKPLLYKAKRLVNWDPKLLTAISDLEVEQREVKGSFAWQRGAVDKDGNPKPFDASALRKLLAREPGGHLYYFDYPLAGALFDAGDPATYVTIATTRPETMLGDTGIAIHPDNDKLNHLIGRQAVLPLVGRLIALVGDEYADPEKGTGAVKITPAHDFNDFEVAKRCRLPSVNMLTKEGQIDLSSAEFDAIPPATRALAGLDRFEARLHVVALMAAAGLLRQVEPHLQQVPHGDRSGVPVEPFLTDQWYVNVKPLAEKSMQWVREGAIRIVPQAREADFFRWMENIEPWCISRQLWWGHQIPAWYGPDGDYVIAADDSEARQRADAKWGAGAVIERDPDVLDTWFSSALWPFSTLGWPDVTGELDRYYPTSVLVTAADILFFWVARMMMAAAATQNDLPAHRQPPFHTVYLHGLVRDEKGRKMSKSVGNVLDPLVVIDQYGADALRFTIATFAAQGRDPKIGVKTAESYRNFATKLWNAARFCEFNGCVADPAFKPDGVSATVNRWILGELQAAIGDISAAIEAYRFNEAANGAYHFVWGTFCDWFVELSKPVLQGPDGPARTETRATAAFVLDHIIRFMHPFMPFITEELWARTAGERARDQLVVLSDWPVLTGLDDAAARSEINWLVRLIQDIRAVRAEMNVPAGAMMRAVLVGAGDTTRYRLSVHDETLRRLARLSEIVLSDEPPSGSLRVVAEEAILALPVSGIVDLAVERKRLDREQARLSDEIAKIDAKLGNPDFRARAPEEVIEEQNERRANAQSRLMRVNEGVAALAEAG